MYTSSDESDEDEPSLNPHLESSSHNTSQKMKFTTFGKAQIIREETLLEEGMESNIYFHITPHSDTMVVTYVLTWQ